MDENLRHLIEESGLVIPSARQHALPPPLRRLHRRILHHFADQAGAPTTLLLHQWAHDLDVSLETALARLVAVDLVEADPPSGRLFGAYPFSATPRGHAVQIDGGPTVHAYCAIDALGIPGMLGRGVGISSRDPHTGESIRVTVTDGQATWQPRDTVVVVGTDNGGREQSACCCRCPYITFHATMHDSYS
jgi:hypothetical protein